MLWWRRVLGAFRARKNIPLQWARTGRSEAERKPGLAEWDKTKRRGYASLDKEQRWFTFRSSLEHVEEGLHFRISKTISRRIGKFSEKKPFRVLDAGCGAGTALAELKKQFGKKIRTVGLVLEKTPGEKYAGVDRLMEGNINEVKPHEQFDFVFSFTGATVHSILRVTAVERVCNWLRPGGTAVIDLRAWHEEIPTVLAQNGIRDYKEKHGILAFTKPKTRLP